VIKAQTHASLERILKSVSALRGWLDSSAVLSAEPQFRNLPAPIRKSRDLLRALFRKSMLLKERFSPYSGMIKN
jgi:hypothetical protein